LGAHIGRYVVRQAVGSGGMGVVVAAYDPELDRPVAIKLVAAKHEESRARLVREAKALARLSHPNVVTVHEVVWIGEHAGIVMELVDGRDLAAWARASERGWRETVGVYVQAARGLGAAHRAGLVHRDFKPSNALLGKDGIVRVTDFGLARTQAADTDPTAAPPVALGSAQNRTSPIEVSLTQTGAVLGTPAYMAPEQHLGTTLDARTDQWALGCSLYEALYDHRPFDGDDRGTLRDRVVAGEIRPEPPSARVPRAVRAAIRRALAPNPAERFADMDELVAVLEAPARRASRIVAGVVVAAVLMSVAAIAMTLRRNAGVHSCAGLDVPLLERWNPERAKALRTKLANAGHAVIADRLISAIDDYGRRWAAARTQACTHTHQGVQSDDKLDRQMRCLDQRVVEFGAVVDGILAADARTLGGATDSVDRLHMISDCDDPHDTVPRPSDAKARQEIERAENDLARAGAFQALGQPERALPLAREAAETGESTGWAPLSARALLLRAECENRTRDFTAALATFNQAANVGAEAKDDTVVVDALAGRFFVLGERKGKPAEALAMRGFVELALARAGQPPRSRAIWLHNLAIILLAQEKFDEALTAEVDAVATWRMIVAPGHPYLIDSLETEGNIQIFRGEFDRAEALLLEVLKEKIAAHGPNHVVVADTLENLGVLEAQRGNLPAAIEHWERGAAIERAAGALSTEAIFNLGTAKLYVGRLHAAAEDLTTALAIAERDAPGSSRWVGLTADALGVTLAALGERDRAAALLDRAIEALRASGTPSVVDALAHASRLALLRGDRTTAKARLAEAVKVTRGQKPLIALAEADIKRAGAGCRAARAGYELAIRLAQKESDRSVETNATLGLGECLTELGAGAEAVTTLEALVKWLGEVHADAEAAAPPRFALARALVASGGDRARAKSLAAQARDGLFGSARAAAARWLGQNAER
jgi:tetratricopeptide (TPR) repeat protein/predicted Ser/Thr protein kinase